MAFSKQFIKALDKLFYQRTHWLRSELGVAKPGKPPKFSRSRVNKGILKLQLLASDAFARKLARAEFEKHTKAQKAWFVKGYGRDAQKKNFDSWFQHNFGKNRGCVYCFWNGKNCVYVGRTGFGGHRPSSHFDKFWFSNVNRVTIQTQSKNQLPRLECLAIHNLQPSHNKNKAATKKWTKSCPLCDIHGKIENELRQVFKLR